MNDFFDDRKIKEITSRERIPARELYGEAFDFKPNHKTWLRGNHKPSVLDATESLWRRLVLIELSKVFTESERIANLDELIIEKERDGILAWMIDGCLEWQKEGLKTPKTIKDATSDYQADTDIIGQWINQKCELVAGARLKTNEAYFNYQLFIREMGMHPCNQITFSKQVSARGFVVGRSNVGRHLVGLRLICFTPFDDEM